MDLRFSPEELAFREEVRGFIRDNLPDDIREKLQLGHKTDKSDIVRWQRILNKKGWAAYSWPKQWGGPGWTPIQRMMFLEEIQTFPAPEVNPFNVTMLGPVLIQFGSDEQKNRFLPRAANLDDWWCQGFSEPGAGSDLASLTCRAHPVDGGWRVNGQKVWTSFAQFSQRCILLTRTGEPGSAHRGITAFFVDVDSPGLSPSPIEAQHGRLEFAEVFYDDVFVPDERRLGDVGQGWQVAMDVLPYERSTTFWHRGALLHHRCDELVAAVANGDPDIATSSTTAKAIGEAFQAVMAFRSRSRDTQYRLAAGGQLGAETSIDKILIAGSEQLLMETARDLLPGTIEFDDDPRAALWREDYLYSKAATIYGGTSEIQRNIIAKTLGL